MLVIFKDIEKQNLKKNGWERKYILKAKNNENTFKL